MEQMKVVHEATQVSYNASTTLQANVKKSCDLGAQFSELEKKQISLNLDPELAKKNLKKAQDEAAIMGDKMKQALEKKDQDLAATQKEAREKTTLADKKLASVNKLEEENSKLKTAVSEANQEVARLKKDKESLTDKVGSLKAKKGELESYLGQLAAKLVLKLEDFEAETGRVKTVLDPINSPVKDDVVMNVLRLEPCLDIVVDYLARLKVAMTRIDAELWPQAELAQDLESLTTRLNQIPS
ncbi:cingulin-like [Triticum dicoccoides]|uniref:cingulin-like n=1 Tax=Triticum dicoccoides TaxID=85692 RepID=UPI00188EC48A|nr:cingulin-like [Triticum dicoccoides]